MHAIPRIVMCSIVLFMSSSLFAQTQNQLSPPPRDLTVLMKTSPVPGQTDVELDSQTSIRFTNPLDPNTIDSNSFQVTAGRPVTTNITLTLDRREVILSYPDFLPGSDTVQVTVVGSKLRDIDGRFVDADGDGYPGGVATISFTTNPALGIPILTETAMITGFVFRPDDVTGEILPFSGVSVSAYQFPVAVPPVQVGVATTNVDGFFQLETDAFTGVAQFLVNISFLGHSEALRQVQILPGRCRRVGDAVLQPLSAPVFVEAATGGEVEDTAGMGACLTIPAGALIADSMISVTVLDSAELIRDDLPELTSEAGFFIDISGVSGEITTEPVSLTLPNQYGLPLGTTIPMGKIDHLTLEWSDMRDLAMDPEGAVGGSAPYFGTVVDDGMGGSVIEIQFDNFCTVCTSYCLPIPLPPPPPPPPPSTVPPPPCGTAGGGNSGYVYGSSAVNLHEGHLFETISLPSFREFGSDWSLQLRYASHTAQPSVTLGGVVDYNSSRPVERTVYDINVEGHRVIGAYGFTQNFQKHYGKYIWKGLDFADQLLPTGSYEYEIFTTSLNANVAVSLPLFFGEGGDDPSVVSFDGVEASPAVFYPGEQVTPGGPQVTPQRSLLVSGRAVLVNAQSTPYGAGWSIAQEHRLHFDPDGCVVAVGGMGQADVFLPDPSNPHRWISPAGDFTALMLNPANGKIRREFPNRTTHYFESTGELDRIEDSFGRTTDFEYQSGLLTTVTSPTGFQYVLTYSGGTLTSISDSAGRTTLTTVDASGDLTSLTNAVGSTRLFEYSDHLLTAQVGARGDRTEYEYTNGRVVETRQYDTDALTLLQTRQYSPTALDGEIGEALANGMGTLLNPIPPVTEQLDQVVDGRGGIHRQEVDSRNNVTSFTDPLNRSTFFGYDANDLLTSVTYPNGRVTEFDYDANGNQIAIREQDAGGLVLGGPGSAYSEQTLEYSEEFGLPTRVIDAEGRQTTIGYDLLGRLVNTTDPLGRTLYLHYEDDDLPTQVTRATFEDGTEITNEYDARGNLVKTTDPLLRETILVNDPLTGRIESVLDGDGNTRSWTYDDLDRVITQLGLEQDLITYSYDDSDCGCSTSLLAQVTFANGSSIDYEYDGLGRRTGITDPLGMTSSITYDAEGSITDEVLRNGDTITYEYDIGGQLIGRAVDGGDFAVFDYDVNGHLTGAANAVSTLVFEYDFLGRQTAEFRTIDPTQISSVGLTPQGSAIMYDYDLAGNRTSMMSTSVGATYTYDANDQLTALTDNRGNQLVFAYDISGRRTLLDRSNGVQTAYSYDAAGQIAEIEEASSGVLSTLSYTSYNATGRLLQDVASGPTPTVTRDYEYDALNRLTDVSHSSLPFGDQLSAILSGDTVLDAANRLTADTELTYAYDAEGRTTARFGATTELFDYDAEGRLRQYREQVGGVDVATVAFFYDPFGRMIAKNTNDVATIYEYDGADLIGQRGRRGELYASTVFGPNIDEPLIERRGSESFFYHHERNGSIRLLTDATGAVRQSLVYDAFGEILDRSDPTMPVFFGYTGRVHQHEMGLIDHRARMRDARNGRFLTEDPAGLLGGSNLYAYGSGDPVNNVDPDGRLAWFLAPIIGGVIGGGIDLATQLIGNGGRFDCVSWGSVGLSAGLGALFASTGPGGALFGRSSSYLQRYGNRFLPRGGVFNGRFSGSGGRRFGWSYNKNTGRNTFGPHGGGRGSRGHWHRDWLSFRHRGGDVPFSANGPFGLGGGVLGGAAGSAGGSPCPCP